MHPYFVYYVVLLHLFLCTTFAFISVFRHGDLVYQPSLHLTTMSTMPPVLASSSTSQEPGSSATQIKAAPESDTPRGGGSIATRKRSARRRRRAAQEAKSSATLREPGSSAYQRLGALVHKTQRQLPQKSQKPQNNLAVDQYLFSRHFIPDSETNDVHSSPESVVPGAQLPQSQLVSGAERSSAPDAPRPDVIRRHFVPDTLPAMTKLSKDGKKVICSVCHVPCSSVKNLNEHLRGRRHRMHVFLSAVDSLR